MTDSKITSTEAIFLVVTIFVAHTLSSLPQNLINNTKSSTIINLIYIGIIVTLISYLIYRLLKNFGSQDIIDISEYLGGKIFKNIIGCIFIIYLVISSSSLLKDFCEGLHIAFFPMTNVSYIIISFVIVLFVTNSLSFGSNIKAISIVFPIVLASIVFLFIGNISHFSYENFFPILGKGFVNTFITGIGNIGALGGIFLLYFLPPYLKKPEKMKKICILSVIIGSIYLILCLATIVFMFSLFVGTGKVLPLYSAARYIEFGTFFQRLESLFMVIWILEICCYLVIINRFSISIIQKLTNIEDQKPLAFIYPLLILGVSLLSKNYATIRYFESKIYFYFKSTSAQKCSSGFLCRMPIRKNRPVCPGRFFLSTHLYNTSLKTL